MELYKQKPTSKYYKYEKQYSRNKDHQQMEKETKYCFFFQVQTVSTVKSTNRFKYLGATTTKGGKATNIRNKIDLADKKSDS